MTLLHTLLLGVNVSEPSLVTVCAGGQTVLIKVRIPVLYQEDCVPQH